MTISALPPPPSRLTDGPDVFPQKADTFFAALPQFVTQANGLVFEANTSLLTTNTARDQAIVARIGSETARDQAIVARNNANAAAALVNYAGVWAAGTYALGQSVFHAPTQRYYISDANGNTAVPPAAPWRAIGDIITGSAPNQVPINAYLGSMAYLDADNIGFAALAANTAAQNLALNKLTTVTISADTTLTTTVPKVGSTAYVIIITSGATSRTVTFGTGFKSTGTLATGTDADRRFVIQFISDGANLVEVSRTTAITY